MKFLAPDYWECIYCYTVWISPSGYICWTPWKQKGPSMAFPFSYKVFETVRGLASILKKLSSDEFLCLHACSVCWEGTLLSHLVFSLIAVPKFVWKDKPFANSLRPPFSKGKSGQLYCPSLHAVTLPPVLSRASFKARSSSSFLCILISCWVHVPPVFISSQTVPPSPFPPTCKWIICL